MRLYILTVLLLLIQFDAFSAVIRVPGDFGSIQEAVNSSDLADTVLISDGWYQETLLLTFGITLTSEYLLDADTLHTVNTILNAEPNDRVIEVEEFARGVFHIIGLTLQDGNRGVGYTGGAAIRGEGIEIHISRCIIQNCFSAADGGAIHLRLSNGSISHTTFRFNVTNWRGGALHWTRGSFELFECNFIENSAQLAGGGAVLYSNSGHVTSCKFIRNFALGPSGGLHVARYTNDFETTNSVEIDNNLFIENISGSMGGAVTIMKCDTVYFHDNLLEQNECGSEETGLGGALSIGDSTDFALIEKNIFRQNFSDNYGGGAAIMSDAIVSNNVFIQNVAHLGAAVTSVFINTFSPNPLVRKNLFIENNPTGIQDSLYTGAVECHPESGIRLHQNDFFSNRVSAAGRYRTEPTAFNAENNYWGHPSGPFHELENRAGQGDTVSTLISILPYSESSFTGPQPFILQTPSEAEGIPELPITFSWHPSVDSLPGGALIYTLELAEDEQFQQFIEYDVAEDTSYSMEELDFERYYWWRVKATNDYDISRYSEIHSFQLTSVRNQTDGIVEEWRLERCYPNPFNDSAQIIVRTGDDPMLNVQIFDIAGRQVAELYHNTIQKGLHSYEWNTPPSSGVYLLRISNSHGWQRSRKLVHLK
ncbi:T9SS type A sorting domain-containing protein [bacterium]|nr:T9SS type A sorting domain-containing protein [bacterium]